MSSSAKSAASRSPIGGVYKWNSDVTAVGINVKAAIVIETVGTETLTDDQDLLEMIDRELDDGNTNTGNLVYAPGALVYVIEK